MALENKKSNNQPPSSKPSIGPGLDMQQLNKAPEFTEAPQPTDQIPTAASVSNQPAASPSKNASPLGETVDEAKTPPSLPSTPSTANNFTDTPSASTINDFSSQANQRTQSSSPLPNPANADKASGVDKAASAVSSAASKIGSTPGASATPVGGYAQAAGKVADKFAQGKAEGKSNGQAAVQAAKTLAVEAAKKTVETAIAATGVGAVVLFIAKNKYARNAFLIFVLAILEIFGSLLAHSIGLQSGTKLDAPNTQYAVGASGVLTSASCTNMQSSLEFTDLRGIKHSLTLPGREGGFSEEDPINPSNGHVFLGGKDKNSKGAVSMWKDIDQMTGKPIPASYYNYYVTARWGYTAWAWDGSTQANAHKIYRDLPSIHDFVGRRIIIFNPKTNKAVLTVIMESGPKPSAAPGTAIAKAREAGKNPVFTVEQDRQAWEAGSGYQLANPTVAGFTDVDLGGPMPKKDSGQDTTETALGIPVGNGEGTPITYGFAPPELQNTPPGPIDCTVVSPKVAAGSSTSPVKGNFALPIRIKGYFPPFNSSLHDCSVSKPSNCRKGGHRPLIGSVTGYAGIPQENNSGEAVDVNGPAGTPVYAPFSGTVLRASHVRRDKDIGMYLVIQSDDKRYVAGMLHLNNDSSLAAQGSHVTVGEQVGTLYDLLRPIHYSAPHLHFELWVDGNAVNAGGPTAGVTPEAIWKAQLDAMGLKPE